MFEPVVLEPGPASLWSRFQNDRLPATQDLPVLSRWRRSKHLGASPHGIAPEEALYRGAALDARREALEPTLSAGEHLLSRAAVQAAEHHYTLLVADREGVIVWSGGGGQFGAEADRIRLIPGASWSERDRGTNAIGTALAERRPVFVRGGAHYGRRFQGIVCYAAPIFDVHGEIVALIDATSDAARVDREMAFGVMTAANAMTELLRLRAYASAGRSVLRAIERSVEHAASPALLIESPGRVGRVNEAARRAFTRCASGSNCAEVLGCSFAELGRLATDGGELHVVDDAGRRHRAQLDPVQARGRDIAVLVVLVPTGISSAPPSAPAAPHAAPHAAVPALEREVSERADPSPFRGMFATDPVLVGALRRAERIADSALPVMLLAETGSGKELVARGIHRASPRRDAPFVPVNCGAVAPSLLESELFGYGPGAFTGADRGGRHGYLHAANGGTLFLDEVAEMPLTMQALLLRVLENGEYRRVGETEARRADVRFVCATCRDLPALVEQGDFRRDLYFRLKGARVELPPLRDRADLRGLVEHLVAEITTARGLSKPPEIADALWRRLEAHDWPGNVRELKSALEVAMILAARPDRLDIDALPVDGASRAAAAPQTSAPPRLADVQGRLVEQVLGEVGGNVSQAARRLGVARSTLYRMMRRYGLAPK